MTRDLAAPRSEVSQYAPALLSFSIPTEKIKELIGKGGETIQKISKNFEIDIEISEEGLVTVTGPSREVGEKAVAHIQAMLRDVAVGDVYEKAVAGKILDGVGVIMNLGSGKSGMMHISKIATARVNVIEDYVKVGDVVAVKVITVDKERGRVGLENLNKK